MLETCQRDTGPRFRIWTPLNGIMRVHASDPQYCDEAQALLRLLSEIFRPKHSIGPVAYSGDVDHSGLTFESFEDLASAKSGSALTFSTTGSNSLKTSSPRHRQSPTEDSSMHSVERYGVVTIETATPAPPTKQANHSSDQCTEACAKRTPRYSSSADWLHLRASYTW